MSGARWLIAVAGVAAAVVLFLVLRPGGRPTAVTSPSPSPSPTSSPTATATPAATPTTPDAREIEVEVEDGAVKGPRQVTVPLGRRVIVTVEADVTDEVHVHGYDLLADVAPGSPARIRFRADVPGVFEVELEGTHLLLFRLEVTA